MSIGYKKTALALFKLHEDDRQWLLSELDESERSSTEVFLSELNDMAGIKENNGFDFATIFNNPIFSIENRNIDFSLMLSVNELEPVRAIAVLKDEPVWVLYSILSCYEWSWLGKFYQRLDVIKRFHLFKYKKEKHKKIPDKILEALLLGFVHSASKSSPDDANNKFEGMLARMKLSHA